jgi:hypothetical protein
MIVFDLLCEGSHRFEGWFASADDFAAQKSRDIVACPVCGSCSIERVPSATRINTGAAEPRLPVAAERKPAAEAAPPGRDALALAQILHSRMLDAILSKTEDVGADFPAEARRIHYGETETRAIRGQATRQEHDELVEEGVPVSRIPVPPTGSWN